MYIDPYYSLPQVSNSDLTKIDDELSSHDKRDLSRAFYEGSIVDAMITEPHRIDWFRNLFDGEPHAFFQTAKKMYHQFKFDYNCQKIMKNTEKQKVSIAELQIHHDGHDFSLPARCKWDFFGTISGDIKTTVATTQKQFEAACMYLDYHRSRAWYMDVGHTDRDLIIGISKVNFKIFFYPITRDMDIYKLGKQRYSQLAFKYWMLKM